MKKGGKTINFLIRNDRAIGVLLARMLLGRTKPLEIDLQYQNFDELITYDLLQDLGFLDYTIRFSNGINTLKEKLTPGKDDDLIATISDLETDQNLNKSKLSLVLFLMEDAFPNIGKAVRINVRFRTGVTGRIQNFLHTYSQKYLKRVLFGQHKLDLAGAYERDVLSHINAKNFIARKGTENFSIDSADFPWLCHTLLTLWYKGLIKINSLNLLAAPFEAVIDNISESRYVKISPKPLPTDVHWETNGDTFILLFEGTNKKLEFRNKTEPTAIYFKLLIENHGFPVSYDKVREQPGLKGKSNLTIRNLVKTLRGKIEENMLGKSVVFEPTRKGSYLLIISSHNESETSLPDSKTTSN